MNNTKKISLVYAFIIISIYNIQLCEYIVIYIQLFNYICLSLYQPYYIRDIYIYKNSPDKSTDIFLLLCTKLNGNSVRLLADASNTVSVKRYAKGLCIDCCRVALLKLLFDMFRHAMEECFGNWPVKLDFTLILL